MVTALHRRSWGVIRTGMELFPGSRVPVPVGTPIAGRPPVRSVRARLRIRLLRRMCGGEAGVRIRVQDPGYRNPPIQDRVETFPSHPCALAATDEHSPP